MHSVDKSFQSILTLEYKSPWSLNVVDIIAAYKEWKKVFIKSKEPEPVKGHVMRAVEQAFIYATLNNHKYCVYEGEFNSQTPNPHIFKYHQEFNATQATSFHPGFLFLPQLKLKMIGTFSVQ